MKRFLFLIGLTSVACPSWGDETLEAAAGGAIGGGVGAAIGEELGGRDGAIIGGAIGGAVGAAVATDDHEKSEAGTGTVVMRPVVVPSGSHCPPGQAKKGRC